MVAINSIFASVNWDQNQCYAHFLDATPRQRALITAINNLAQQYRQFVILFAFERRSKPQIAEMFSYPLESVRMALFLCGELLEKKCRTVISDFPSEQFTLSIKYGGQFAIFGELAALKCKLKPQMELC